jgi:hypothetical protein
MNKDYKEVGLGDIPPEDEMTVEFEKQMELMEQASYMDRMMDLSLEITQEYIRTVIQTIHKIQWHPDPVINDKIKNRAVKRMQALIDFKYAVELEIPEIENGEDTIDSDKKV